MLQFVGLLRQNVRNYAMFIALAVIVAFFSIATGGLFISPYNLTNLINQTGAVGILAAGMTLIIIIRHIDLSVGYLCGFYGAVAAVFLTQQHLLTVLAIVIVLVLGGLFGLLFGVLAGKVGVPSFVATLAGMIGGEGLLLLATSAHGTISITDGILVGVGNGFVPSWFRLGRLNGTTVVIGLLGMVAFVVTQVRGWRKRKASGADAGPVSFLIAKIALAVLVTGFFAYEFGIENGISWTFVILAIVVSALTVVLNRTRFGRYVYGVGGNPEAAELSGVSVARVTITVFVIMGVLTGLAGLLYAGRMQSASPTGGTGFELLAIAAAFIGGCSASGGVGKVTGSVVGALIMQSLVNGMMLMEIDVSIQYIVQGVILVAAVVFDVVSRRSRAVA